MGKGPFTKYGAGIYIGGGCRPNGTTKFAGLRLEPLNGDLPTKAELDSRELDSQGFVVTNNTKTSIGKIVITQTKKDSTFNGLTTGDGIASKIEGGTLTLTFDPPLGTGDSLWFGLPPFVDGGVTIEYAATPTRQPKQLPKPMERADARSDDGTPFAGFGEAAPA